MKGLVAPLFLLPLAALPAQTPFDNAPIAFELRTNDASFAATVQKALRTVERDPRREGDAGSIRVRLRHAADIGQRVSETSVGPPLAAGAFAEIEIDPKVALAAYAPDVDALRKTWARGVEAAVVASGWSKGSGEKLVATVLGAAGQIAGVRATITGDPRQPASSFRIVADVAARDGTDLLALLGKLRPAKRVCGDTPGEGEIGVSLNLGDGIAELLDPLLGLAALSPETAEADVALARQVIATWDGSFFLRIATDMRTSFAFAFGARDAAAMWKLVTDPQVLARNTEARARKRRDVEYRVGAHTHRDVPIMQIDGAPTGTPKVTSQFAAIAGDALWFVFGPNALDSLRAAIDAGAAGKPQQREMADGEVLRVETGISEDAKAPAIRASVVRRDQGVSIDVAVTR